MANTMADDQHKHETGEMNNLSVISLDLQQAIPVPKLTVSKSDVWLTVHCNSVWIGKTN